MDTAEQVMIIAEVGNNHEGDFGLAKEMAAAAVEAGADAVKFQTIVPERLVSATQTERIKQLTRFQFSYDQFAELADEVGKQGAMFLSTPFDLDSARFLAPLVPAFKIASSDNTFFPLIEAVISYGKPLLLSVGLCDHEEILKTIDFIRKKMKGGAVEDFLSLLHCVSSYPTPHEEANLLAIQALGEYGTPGYSDHTLGIEAAAASVAFGARIVEKHFTLDHHFSDFRDHQLSADPQEFAAMVNRIRLVEKMRGKEGVVTAACEEGGRTSLRRSVVAAEDLPKGTLLTMEDLTWVRPGGGVAPGDEGVLLGRKLIGPKEKGEQILLGDVE